jgi:hypothetical protein
VLGNDIIATLNLAAPTDNPPAITTKIAAHGIDDLRLG